MERTLPALTRPALALAALLAALGPAAAGARAKPDVLIISACSVRADHLGCYGHERPTSPRLDRLAEDSVVFETAITASNWTLPATLSVFTSLPPSAHGVDLYERPVKPGVVRMAEVFQAAGYHTAGWVSNFKLHEVEGFEAGFDSFSAFQPWSFEVPLAWLETAPRPLFLYVHAHSTHFKPFRGEEVRPYEPPAEFVEMFLKGRRAPDLPPHDPWFEDGAYRDTVRDLTDAEKEDVRLLYDAGIRATDEFIGGLLDRFRKMGAYEDGVVVFYADHGEGLFEHGLMQHLGSHHDEVVRSALIVKAPRRRHAGRRVRAQVRTLDIMPTVLELAGLRPSPALAKQMRGASLLPLMKKDGAGRDACVETRHRPMLMSSFRRRDGWKLIFDRANNVRRLYDTSADPDERRDLFEKNSAEAAELEEALWRCLERENE
jgi:arylsulfatase A-like enzyme